MNNLEVPFFAYLKKKHYLCTSFLRNRIATYGRKATVRKVTASV